MKWASWVPHVNCYCVSLGQLCSDPPTVRRRYSSLKLGTNLLLVSRKYQATLLDQVVEQLQRMLQFLASIGNFTDTSFVEFAIEVYIQLLTKFASAISILWSTAYNSRALPFQSDSLAWLNWGDKWAFSVFQFRDSQLSLMVYIQFQLTACVNILTWGRVLQSLTCLLFKIKASLVSSLTEVFAILVVTIFSTKWSMC